MLCLVADQHIRCVAGFRFHFLNDAEYTSAYYGHFCTAIPDSPTSAFCMCVVGGGVCIENVNSIILIFFNVYFSICTFTFTSY
jgi:hypothetical protein